MPNVNSANVCRIVKVFKYSIAVNAAASYLNRLKNLTRIYARNVSLVSMGLVAALYLRRVITVRSA